MKQKVTEDGLTLVSSCRCCCEVACDWHWSGILLGTRSAPRRVSALRCKELQQERSPWRGRRRWRQPATREREASVFLAAVAPLLNTWTYSTVLANTTDFDEYNSANFTPPRGAPVCSLCTCCGLAEDTAVIYSSLFTKLVAYTNIEK